jgi:hypothetical protein
MNFKENLIKDTSFVLIFLLAVFSLIRVWDYGRSSAGIDFYQFWVAGQAAVQQDKTNIYLGSHRKTIGLAFLQKSYASDSSARQRSAAEKRKVLETYSTPFLYTLFYLITTGDYERDLQTYQLLSLLSCVVAILVFCQLLGYPFTAAMAAVVVFTSWFGPFLSDIRVANVNQIQLGMLALYLWVQNRHAWGASNFLGGLVLGFAFMFKPNLIFVISMLVMAWLINRRFRRLIITCSGIAISSISAIIISSIAFGSVRCWISWISALQELPDNIITLPMGNLAPARLILDLVGIEAQTYLMVIFSSIALLFIWKGRCSNGAKIQIISDDKHYRETELLQEFLIVGSGCLLYLLSARLVWLHYYLLSIPLALLLLRPLNMSPSPAAWGLVMRRLLAALALVLVGSNPLVSLFKLSDPYHFAFLTVSGTLILFGLAMYEILGAGDQSVRMSSSREKENYQSKNKANSIS